MPVQILKLGNVFVLSAPSEFTTMAGRRLRNAIRDIIEGEGSTLLQEGQKAEITIAGLTNTYSSYVTTYEEYQAQRYEAASTIFGPHTLEGYIQEFSRLARDMVAGRPSTSDAPPPNKVSDMLQLMPEAHPDRVPVGHRFGDVVDGGDVASGSTFTAGVDTVSATFHAANPRHNQRLQGTFLEVQRASGSGGRKDTYTTVAVDGDWETKFHWQAGPEDPLDLGFSRTSEATLTWAIPDTAAAGTYRLCYNGDFLTKDDEAPTAFTGCSSTFQVTSPAKV